MFERYTQEARRVIFFARYEASYYGSQYIDTEHILLGIVREDRALMSKVLGLGAPDKLIRPEIEKAITKGERIPTSVEVPLSQDSKKVLDLAAEEAERLAQRYVGPEHLLLGLLGVRGSLAAKILLQVDANPTKIREQLSKRSEPAAESARDPWIQEPKTILGMFLTSLESGTSSHPSLFAQNVQVIDASGQRWSGREEVKKNWEALFAAYARRNALCIPDRMAPGPADSLIANLLWENVAVSGESRKLMHRMIVLIAKEGDDWAMFLVQVTPVVLP